MRTRKTIIVVSIIASLFFFLANPPLQLPAFKISIISPLLVPLEVISVYSDKIKKILPQSSIHKEEKFLTQKITDLERRVAELQESKMEAERLKRLLSYKKGKSSKEVVARLVARDPSSWKRTVIINRGRSDGIGADTVVVSEAGLVGRVFEVGGDFSKVITLDDPDFRASVLIQRNRQQGLLKGTIGGRCEVIYLDKDAEILSGDRVITSGMGGVFPKGLYVGDVVEAYKDKLGMSQVALIEPAQDLDRMEEVLCLVED
ncbi:MAG: rod shape-determining protein MreC [Candidatus Omnitrophica bacterium]|nr:rod shape-determining protein MreC [Candidatus Omnitrophota bacterium]